MEVIFFKKFIIRLENGTWIKEVVLEGHNDWVRDVAWAPSIGLTQSYIASCSQVSYYFFRNVSDFF